MRQRYEQQMQHLHDDLLRIGSRVDHGLSDALKALASANPELGNQVVAADREIDRTHQSIDEQVMDIIATQQPVARDLRTLLAIGAIASELERTGDYAKGIAKRVSSLLQQSPIVTPPQTIIGMGELAHTMLLQCLDAFVKRDVDLARQLGEKDKQVDALEDEANEQIRQMIRDDISTLNSGLILIEITYMLERLAVRTTNIGVRVIYMVNSGTEVIND